MTNSKRIAGLLGPTIVVVVASEFPLVQPHLYDEQIPPVVYLSGVMMFVAGLAILREARLDGACDAVRLVLTGIGVVPDVCCWDLSARLRQRGFDILHDSRGSLDSARAPHDLQGV
jgi:hypothetical protein